MSSNATLELALRDEPQAVMLTQHQLIVIANTDFVPKGLRGNVPAVLACVARGRAMGIPDMVALNGISIIEGKATLTAELMSAIAREHGHSITGDVSATRAVARGKRGDNGDTMTAEFTMEMAETAGLLNKFNWKKHPDDMLWARAVSKLCRRLFADCYAGGTYTPEEMEVPDTFEEITAEEVIDEPSDRPGTGTPEESPAVGAGEKVPQPDSPPHPPVPYEHIEPILDETFTVFVDTEPDPEPEQAEVATFGSGRHAGETLAQVWDEDPESEGHRYIVWAVKSWKTGAIARDLEAFAAQHPEVFS